MKVDFFLQTPNVVSMQVRLKKRRDWACECDERDFAFWPWWSSFRVLRAYWDCLFVLFAHPQGQNAINSQTCSTEQQHDYDMRWIQQDSWFAWSSEDIASSSEASNTTQCNEYCKCIRMPLPTWKTPKDGARRRLSSRCLTPIKGSRPMRPTPPPNFCETQAVSPIGHSTATNLLDCLDKHLYKAIKNEESSYSLVNRLRGHQKNHQHPIQENDARKRIFYP